MADRCNKHPNKTQKVWTTQKNYKVVYNSRKIMTEKKQWCVYILECMDDSLYTGITNNLDKRMTAHKEGKGSKYVNRKKFNRLLHTIKAADKVDAARLEYKIKQLERNDKISFFMKHPLLDFSVSKTNNI